MKFNRKNGFSLIEFMIYVAIVSVIGLIAGGTFLGSQSSRLRNQSRVEVNSSLNFVLSKIKDDLKNATSVSSPPPGDSASVLTLVVNGQVVRYSFDTANGLIARGVGIDESAATLARVSITSGLINVSAMDFQYIQNTNSAISKNMAMVRVDITAEFVTGDPSREFSESRRATFSMGKTVSIARPSATALEPGPADDDLNGKNIPKRP